MTEEEHALNQYTRQINSMTHVEMARLVRFAPAGHPYFHSSLHDIFIKRFQEFGGMTPEISKALGW